MATQVNNMTDQPVNARYPYHAEFCQYLLKQMGAARSTINNYEKAVRRFYDWLRVNHKFTDPKKLTKHHIKGFRDCLEVQRYRKNSILIFTKALKCFLQYLTDMNILEESPYPDRLNVRGQREMPHLVPTPTEIFKIRLQPKVKPAQAALFEVLLSTGMREGELMQTRVRDINFNDRPFDQELNRPSPYFVASIALKQTTHATKNRMPRKVYLSAIAVKVLQIHINKEHLHHPDTGLFPWSDSYLQDMIRSLGEGIISRSSDDLISNGGALLSNGNSDSNKTTPGSDAKIEKQRLQGFVDVDLDEINVSDDFRRLMERRQKAELELEDYKRQASQPLRQRVRKLHPHALRHAFTNFCYYRSPLGTRQDQHNLRILMGHSGVDSVIAYLKTLPLIADDAVWRRLWQGKPEDWFALNF